MKPLDTSINTISPLAIAPMIDWTYDHFRVFMRLLVPQALLYTEMQATGAVLNNPVRALSFCPAEQPLALQIGGAEEKDLVACARLAEEKGFAELNLNLGCPSDKVQAGRFGACLMAEPEHVASCIRAIKKAVTIPVTVKTRIGIDNQDSYDFFAAFIRKIVAAGCDKLIIHARKAWLHGLNPKQNRTIPPLHYDFVYRIKEELPTIPVIINGNISTIEEINEHMQWVDGVMIGRLACQNPYALTVIHHRFYPHIPMPTRHTVVSKYLDYALHQFSQGTALSRLLKPILPMAHGLAGAKRWKENLMHAQQQKQWAKVESAAAILAEAEQQRDFHELSF